MFISSVSSSGSCFVSRTRFSDAVRNNQNFPISISRKQSACQFEEVSKNESSELRFRTSVCRLCGDRLGGQETCLVAAGRRLDERQQGEIEHRPEAVESWAAMLAARFGGQPVAVAVEQSRGALVFMLGKYEHLHVYPIHPRAAAQFRGALYPSGAKDDPADADLLLDLLVHHRSHLRRLDPDTEQTRLVRHLVEARRKLVNERTRQSNRLTAQLKVYFPQILDWFDDINSALVGDLLKRWPTLEALQKARPQTVRSFLAAHNCRRKKRPRWP